jgi:Cu(I)/Ag(I) efflux system membrane fusion protein
MKLFKRYGILLCALPVLAAIASSCKQKPSQQQAKTKADVYYTCSMHPQIKEDKPGKCPICQMDLIAVPKSSMQANNEVHLNTQQIQLGNISVDTVKTSSIGDNQVLAGTLNFDQQKLLTVTARVEGRLEKLYVKQTGSYVHKGDKLYDLYSEQLNTAKQEYLTALEEQSTPGNTLVNYAALAESAKNKLLLWGMTAGQLSQLASDKITLPLTSFYSPADGYVTALNMQEGSYAMEGSPVIQLADLADLWAEAQVYTTEMNALSIADNIAVKIPGLNNLSIQGKAEFINPEINPLTRINLVRVTIPNNNNQLYPGMPVYIVANNRQRHGIVLPADAVLQNGKGASVWVQTKPGIYTVRMVQTGITSGNAIEIIWGLQAGDMVVISGAYLLNSEYIFENGANPMAGMKM